MLKHSTFFPSLHDIQFLQAQSYDQTAAWFLCVVTKLQWLLADLDAWQTWDSQCLSAI